MSIYLKCFVFDWIEVFYVNLFACQGKFYYQINKNKLKTVSIKEDKKENDDKKQKKKLKLPNYLSNLWNKRPKVVLRQVDVDYRIEIEDVKNRALIEGCGILLTNCLLATNVQKLKIKEFELNQIDDNTNFSGLNVEVVLGFTLFKIIFYVMYAMLVKKKYKVAN